MRNITISLDDETARWARVAAAERDMSVSRFMRELLQESRTHEQAYNIAMERFLHRTSDRLSSNSALPSRDELHER